MVLRKVTPFSEHKTTAQTPSEPSKRPPSEQRRRNRVALRSASPKPAFRVALRSQTPTHVSVSSSKGSSVVSVSSLRAQDASRSRPLWVSPTSKVLPKDMIKSPAKQDVSAEHAENTSRNLIRNTRTTYSLNSLLALRPSQVTEKWRELGLRRQRKITQDMQLRPGSANVSKIFTFGITQKIISPQVTRRTPRKELLGEQKAKMIKLSRCSPSQVTKKAFTSGSCRSQRQQSLDKIRIASSEYRSGYRTAEKRDSNNQDFKYHPEYQDEQKFEDLVPRLRSALSNCRQNRDLGVPRKVQSVKWDHAAVPYVESGVPSHSISEKLEFSGERIPLADEYMPSKQEIAGKGQRSQVPKEARGRVQKEDNVHEFMKSITGLKKGDQRKLAQLLEALRNIDSGNSSDNDSVVIKRYKPVKFSRTKKTGTKLNPTAPVFRGKSLLREANSSESIGGQDYHPQLCNPRRRPHAFKENYGLSDPVWHKTIDRLPPANRTLGEFQNGIRRKRWTQEPTPAVVSNLPDMWQDDYNANLHHASSCPHLASVDGTFKSPWYDENVGFSMILPDVNQSFPEASTYQMLPYPQSNQSIYGPYYNHGLLNIQWRTNFDKMPATDLATSLISKQDAFGREALVRPGNQGFKILENFRRRFPLTGNLRAAPTIPINMRIAAEVQQRLEYLLLMQKEMKAHEQLLPDVPISNSDSSRQKNFRQLFTQSHGWNSGQPCQKQHDMDDENFNDPNIINSLPSEILSEYSNHGELEETESKIQEHEHMLCQTDIISPDSESEVSTCVKSPRRASI